MTQTELLQRFSSRARPVSMREMGRYVHCTHDSFASAWYALEREGLITLSGDYDGNAKRYRLTARGHAKAAAGENIDHAASRMLARIFVNRRVGGVWI